MIFIIMAQYLYRSKSDTSCQLILLVLHKILEEVRKNGERMTDLEERVKKVETEESSSKPAPRKNKSANPSPQLRVNLVWCT